MGAWKDGYFSEENGKETDPDKGAAERSGQLRRCFSGLAAMISRILTISALISGGRRIHIRRPVLLRHLSRSGRG